MSEQPRNESPQPPQTQPGILSRIKESLNFKKMSRGKALYTIMFLCIVGLMIFLYVYTYLGTFTNNELGDSTLLTEIIVRLFVVPVTQMGSWGVLLFFGIMMLQCIIAPIPSELVQIVGGLIFGIWLGSLYSFAGIMITSFIGYFIAIRGGAHVIEAAIGQKNVKPLEHFIGKYGIWAMIFGRGIPIIPFDLVTYGAGLVKMSRRDYLIGTAIGTVPRSVFYAWVGSVMFPVGGAVELVSLLELGKVAEFDAKLEAYSGPFNLVLTLTILIVGGGLLLFQLVIMPLVRKKAARVAKQVPPQTSV